MELEKYFTTWVGKFEEAVWSLEEMVLDILLKVNHALNIFTSIHNIHTSGDNEFYSEMKKSEW